jgi:hypothetical protein
VSTLRKHPASAGLAGVLLLAGLAGTAVAAGPFHAGGSALGERLVCRTFPVELREGADELSSGFDTADATHPIGAWVQDMSERGWQLASVQLAVGQKPTGFPIGYQQVCITPQ